MAGDTIAAVATPLGEGGIGIVRLSGSEAVAIADQMFRRKDGKSLAQQPTYTLRYGKVVDPETGRKLDEAIAAIMRPPILIPRRMWWRSSATVEWLWCGKSWVSP